MENAAEGNIGKLQAVAVTTGAVPGTRMGRYVVGPGKGTEDK